MSHDKLGKMRHVRDEMAPFFKFLGLDASEEVFAACETGDLRTLKRLIEKKSSLVLAGKDFYQATSLHWACRYVC